ncbi:helix-turn-helix transcriptional regulator [Fannyhessea vaginae]|uniref:helix-turn-helix transcriptional regulator n=1 Tax=Fannyhessea vaginae TaxID=82135 RepID=UPI00336AE1E0
MSLRDKRKERKLTQMELAQMFGIGYKTYQNYENGRTSPTMEQAAQLARYFNCTIGELFDLKEGNNEDYDNCENKLIYLYRKMSEREKHLYIAIGEDIVNAK